MKLVVPGPNLNDQTRGSFHVHAHGCADLKHYGPGTKNGGAEINYTDVFDVQSKLELVSVVYGDILTENDDIPESYLGDFWFAPCVQDLPLGVTTS